MATVPRQVNPEVRVNPTPFVPQSSEGATADVFGAGAGRALQEGGQSLMRTADQFGDVLIKQQIDDNTREAKNLDMEMSERLRLLAYGDGKTPGFYGLRGQAAIDARPKFEEGVAKAHGELSGRASNGKVRETFDLSARGRINSEFETVGRFTIGERKRADDVASDGRKMTAISDMAQRYNDPKAWDASVGIIRGETLDRARREGWDEQTTARKFQEDLSIGVEKAVRAAMAGEDHVSAERLIAKYGDQIDGAVRGELVKLMRDGSVLKQAQILSDEAYARFPNDATAGAAWIKDNAKLGKERSEALQAYLTSLSIARGEKSERRADAAEIRSVEAHAQSILNHKISMDRRERDEAERKLTSEAWQLINSGRTPSELPVEMYAELSKIPGRLADMERFTTQRAKTGQGYARVDDPKVMDELHAKLLKDPEGFAELRLEQYSTSLTEETLKHQRGLQRGIASKEERERQKVNSYSRHMELFAGALPGVGLTGSDKADERSRAMTMYRQELDIAAQNSKNGLVPAEQAQKILNSVLDPIVKQRGGGAIGRELFGATSTTRLYDVKVPLRGDPERDQLEARHRAALGRAPTDLELAAAWVNRELPERDDPRRVQLEAMHQRLRGRPPTKAEAREAWLLVVPSRHATAIRKANPDFSEAQVKQTYLETIWGRRP